MQTTKIKESDIFSTDLTVKQPYGPKSNADIVVTKKKDYLSLYVVAITLFAVLAIIVLALLFNTNFGSSELQSSKNVNVLKEELKSVNDLRLSGLMLSALKTKEVEGR